MTELDPKRTELPNMGDQVSFSAPRLRCRRRSLLAQDPSGVTVLKGVPPCPTVHLAACRSRPRTPCLCFYGGRCPQ